ncbi:nucleoside recognition domain-containing protein [Clostridium sp. CF012]|uniref:nucleoside recognition domain-containing protein n=1 Tax=Clostridium sp. CF012 TaxID=2843319 RepID=UPI001C0C98FA|nr:nucleoside recognition domain-containing protein [Clostridium sp. CF012]MBU3145923.1 spore maturation protein [Clostridium sp. CF012]
MINIIWFLILSLGIVIGIITGKGEVLSKAVVLGAGGAVELVMGLVGMMCLWCGIMKIAEKSGLTDKLASVLKPILKIIFKEAGKNQKAMSSITMNLTANMMGLSNAATPFGIKAMEEMQRTNNAKDTASNDMALFLVLNAACIQFLPTTVISIRAAYNSRNPAIIILPAIIATGTAAILGVVYCKILQRYF